MNIGILGAGNVGGNLGRALAARGHAVLYGVRDPASPKAQAALKESGPKVRSGSLAEAAAFGEVVVLAVPWKAVRETIENAGNLEGKILIDTTNHLGPRGADETANSTADVARLAQGAKVVKAFNTMGAESLLRPEISAERITAFIAGDDPHAKATVIQLAEEIGLDAVDAGTLANGEILEGLTRLWIQLTQRYGRELGWKLLRP